MPDILKKEIECHFDESICNKISAIRKALKDLSEVISKDYKNFINKDLLICNSFISVIQDERDHILKDYFTKLGCI